ncbi:MAG: sortase [Clostridiales bacterium]|nr:sortase [Clostridiales bacterium]
MQNNEEPLIYVDGQAYIGFISIPSLDIKLPVQADWSLKQLKISPCRYTGRACDGSLIVCAHNYQSHFGKLKYLNPGEKIIFTDCLGKEYVYRIDSSALIGAYDIEEMKNDDGWDLTLFTCTYGGRQRVTLRCSLIPATDE